MRYIRLRGRVSAVTGWSGAKGGTRVAACVVDGRLVAVMRAQSGAGPTPGRAVAELAVRRRTSIAHVIARRAATTASHLVVIATASL